MYNLLPEDKLDEIRTVRAEEIESFDPKKQAIELVPVVYQRIKNTLTIARTLFIAHQFYSELGKEKRALNLKQLNEVDLPEGYRSFQEFCGGAKLNIRAAYRFLDKFVPGTSPEEDRLLTAEEIAGIKREKRRKELIRVGTMVSHFQKTGEYLPGWDCKCDHELEDRRIAKMRAMSYDLPSRPKQLELDFDGYVETLLEPAEDLKSKIAMIDDLIRKLEAKKESYIHPQKRKRRKGEGNE